MLLSSPSVLKKFNFQFHFLGRFGINSNAHVVLITSVCGERNKLTRHGMFFLYEFLFPDKILLQFGSYLAIALLHSLFISLWKSIRVHRILSSSKCSFLLNKLLHFCNLYGFIALSLVNLFLPTLFACVFLPPAFCPSCPCCETNLNVSTFSSAYSFASFLSSSSYWQTSNFKV